MKSHLFKNYFLEGRTLVKENFLEREHLMWSVGGVPCVDARFVWDKHSDEFDEIRFVTDKGKVWSIPKDTFDLHKRVLDKGFGVQYYVSRDKWLVEPLNQDKLL